jgi:hypothetical protein
MAPELMVVRMSGWARRCTITHVPVHGTLSCLLSRMPGSLGRAFRQASFAEFIFTTVSSMWVSKSRIYMYIRRKYKSTDHANHSTLWCIIPLVEISLIYPGFLRLTSAWWWHLVENVREKKSHPTTSPFVGSIWSATSRALEKSSPRIVACAYIVTVVPEISVELGGGPT